MSYESSLWMFSSAATHPASTTRRQLSVDELVTAGVSEVTGDYRYIGQMPRIAL
jgi:hypothetical protein